GPSRPRAPTRNPARSIHGSSAHRHDHCPSTGQGHPGLVPVRSLSASEQPPRMTSTTELAPAGAPAATPQVAINDIRSAEDFMAAIDLTIKYFNDGDIVEGIIVKVDRDEVLLDIGYKTEGVIP